MPTTLAQAQGKPVEIARATTEVRVAHVSVPAPERIYAKLQGQEGALPEVELALGGASPTGEPLEWQWSLNGGMWRPFTADARPVIRDPALAVQGRHTIQVRARVAGRYETTDLEGQEVTVVVDSAAPRIFVGEARRDGDELVVPVVDAVTASREVELAVGRIGAATPETAWAATEGRLALADLEGLVDARGRVALFARDGNGNQAVAELDVSRMFGFHGQMASGGDGCSCHVGAGDHAHGGGALAALLGALLPAILLFGRRLRRVMPFLPLVALLLLLGACSSAQLSSVECVSNAECASKCPPGQVGMCDTAGACKCLEDIPIGWIGQYSDVAVASNGAAWISAYNQEHGDLMVAQHTGTGRVPDTAWAFVDGVPSGPVVNAATTVRGGIRDSGDDVGLYTSIALSGSEPVVAYYDKTNTSLRFASRAGGQWKTMVVDAGVANMKDIGKYTAISVDATGRPGIAYLAIITDGRTARTEVRFAQAKVTAPAAASDWTQSVIESKAKPADPNQGMLDDIPYINGVFITATRTPEGNPVVAWYDRIDGSLKLAEWNTSSGGFKAPVVVDGAAAASDVGWYPSLAVTPDRKIQIAYVDATRDNLLATVYPDGVPEVVDDGLRTDGVTAGGLPRPVSHFVGDNSAYVASGTARAVAYMDSTAHELRLATRGSTTWSHQKIAGSDTPYKASYGFYTAAAMAPSGEVVMTTFAVNQTTRERWVEVFRKSP